MRVSTLAALLATAVSVYAQYQQSHIEFWNALGHEHLQQKLRWKAPTEKGPKNVIFFLGDGMGLSMVTAGRVIAAEKAGREYRNEKWSFEKFDFSGILKTSSYDFHTTDSAAGAMALFSGHKVEQNTLGRLPGFGETCEKGDAAHINDGIAELALARGLDVGVVSTTRLTDATPAANFAKGVHRQMEHDSSKPILNTKCTDIAQQILRHPADKFKVLMGGGHSFFTPTEEGGSRTDGRNIEKEWQSLPGGHRTLITTVDQLKAHNVKDNDQVLGVFHKSSFEYYLDEIDKNNTVQPRLVDMAVKAVEVLQKSSNQNGYYLMIEGGHIDLAEHANMMNLATGELSEFSHTIETIRGMVGEDTLIVVTADHGHALTLPGYVHKHHSILDAEVEEEEMDADGKKIPNILFGAGTSTTDRNNITEHDRMQPHFQSVAAFPAKWGAHGGEDLGVWSQGPYSWLFSGSMENTQMAYLIKFLLCLDPKEPTLCGMRKDEPAVDNYATAPTSAALKNDGASGPSSALITVLAVIAATASLATVILSVLLLKARKPNKVESVEMNGRS